MSLKALARFLYATVPGAAPLRFAIKDFSATYFFKPEYRGVTTLPLQNNVIVDVGANRGQSIAAFKSLLPNSKIIAFEPEPITAKRLTARYRKDPTVTIHKCALSAQQGTMTLFVPRYGRWDCDGMASTDRMSATSWLTDPGRMYHFDKRKLTVQDYSIECKMLDTYDTTPSLIKLCAQGAELEIVKGSQNTIQKYQPALMCAFPTRAFTEFVAGFGYKPYTYSNGEFTPGTTAPPVTFTWYLTNSHHASTT